MGELQTPQWRRSLKIPEVHFLYLSLFMDYNIIFWNCRSTSSAEFIEALLDLVRIYNPYILVLVETKTSGNRAVE